jgi:hypothetical protein
MAARSKFREVIDHSDTGIAGSTPNRGMDIQPCFVCSCVVLWFIVSKVNTKFGLGKGLKP